MFNWTQEKFNHAKEQYDLKIVLFVIKYIIYLVFTIDFVELVKEHHFIGIANDNINEYVIVFKQKCND